MTITFPKSLEKIIAEVVERAFNEALERIEKEYQALYTVFIEAFMRGDIMRNIEEAKNNGELYVIERYLGFKPGILFNLPIYREELYKYMQDNDLFDYLANECMVLDPYDINIQTNDSRKVMIEEIFHRIGNDIMDQVRLRHTHKDLYSFYIRRRKILINLAG